MRAQTEAASGKITEPRGGSKETRKGASASRGKSNPDTLDRIDGKWWTTRNGFGDSEVVFSQNGSQIKGVIRYADGRTGKGP